MMKPTAFHFTTHAVERFIQRVMPGLSDHEALLALNESAGRAVRIDQPTRAGDSYWRVEHPAMRFVTKLDTNGHVVVTIVEGHGGGEEEAMADVVEAYRRARAYPDVGASELIRPCDGETRKDCASWAHVEVQRLITERKRLAALAAQSRAAEVNAGALGSMRDLLRDVENHLANVDPHGSVQLLVRINRTLRGQS